MNHVQALAGQAEWVAGNLAYNLGFIPEDKLNWKPAPTANSALEIVNHVVNAIKTMQPVLSGGGYGQPDFPHATNLDEARQLLKDAAHEYAEKLRTLKPEDLQQTVQLGFGPMP